MSDKPNAILSFRLTSEVTDQSVINADTDLESVWSCASGSHITLWCDAEEVSGLTKSSYSGRYCHHTSPGVIPMFLDGISLKY